jgi:hypothetical protein
MNDPDTAVKLLPEYDSCLLGIGVTTGEERFAYSLRKLVRMKMMEYSVKASEAREIVKNEVILPLERDFGVSAPIFIDDESVQGQIEDTEKPLIILPGK